MILSRDEKGEQNVLNIIYWLAFDQRFKEELFQKMVSILLNLILESISYSNLYENLKPNTVFYLV